MPGQAIPGEALTPEFFDRDAQEVARGLLGKVLAHRVEGLWLQAAIVEAEAYYLAEKGSHASLGFTEKRRALFMPPGTIYMYYARGGDSLNFSCRGAGNAVLIKGAVPYSGLAFDGVPQVGAAQRGEMLARMQRGNPLPSGRKRPLHRLCAGQTLLCRALGLRVPDWNGRLPEPGRFAVLDVGYRPAAVVCTTRLGIPEGRDPQLPYRFVDRDRLRSATRNPISRDGREYRIVSG